MHAPFTTSFMSMPVSASPGRVWRGLTAGPVAALLPGLTVTSDWQAGSPVRLEASGCSVFGEVLRSAPPHRLTYTLGAPLAGGADPTVIVTWEVRPAPGGGSIVDLSLDDLAPGLDDDELRANWHAVLRSLKERAEGPATVVGAAG